MPLPARRAALVKSLAFAALLFALNFYLCRELFWTPYLDNFQSNEGSLAILGKFFAAHPGARWFPLWNIGLPAENTYAPMVPILVALLVSLSGASPIHSLHLLVGLFFCAVPVVWYGVACRWGVRPFCAFTGTVLYSLISPAALLFHAARTDLARITDSRRMMDVFYYGDIAHTLALGTLPLALFAMERTWRTGRTRYWLAAILVCGATVLSNGFGSTSLLLGTLALLAALDWQELRRAIPVTAAIAVLAYLCVCPLLTPALIRVIAQNSQMVGGDYRFSLLTPAGWAILLAGLAAVRLATRRATFPERFVAAFAWLFTGLLLVYFLVGIPIFPQVERYHTEVDMGLAIGFALCLWRLPARWRMAALAVALVVAAPQTVRLRHIARGLLRPVEIARTPEYRASRWIAQNLPGERVLVTGGTEFWFNLFADNPQLSAGHEPLAPNFMQRVAVYTIYTGTNAGARDAEYSIFWLKAFGTGAVQVPGPSSTLPYHSFVNPGKFEGLLPKLWQEGGDTIYSVPLRSPSLAHVIPAAAVVTRQPIHGLDTAPAEAYVRALDDPALPEVRLRWDSPDLAAIHATLAPGQVISVQVTYDPGWAAWESGIPVPLAADALGMIVMRPRCTGGCDFRLEFTGGWRRELYRAISWATLAALLLWAATRTRWRPLLRNTVWPRR